MADMTAREAIDVMKQYEQIAEGDNDSEAISAFGMALTALEALTPRVLTIEKMKSLSLPMVVWYESKGEIYSGKKIVVRRINHEIRFEYPGWDRLADYGIDWRCWSHKPTAEQMTAEKWL